MRRCPGRRAIASTSARHADITLTVDGKEVTVPQGMIRLSANSLFVLMISVRLCTYSGMRSRWLDNTQVCIPAHFYKHIAHPISDSAIMTGEGF